MMEECDIYGCHNPIDGSGKTIFLFQNRYPKEITVDETLKYIIHQRYNKDANDGINYVQSNLKKESKSSARNKIEVCSTCYSTEFTRKRCEGEKCIRCGSQVEYVNQTFAILKWNEILNIDKNDIDNKSPVGICDEINSLVQDNLSNTKICNSCAQYLGILPQTVISRIEAILG